MFVISSLVNTIDMYLLPLVLLLGSAISAASSQQVTDTIIDDRAERYPLPNDVQPSFYDLILYFDPNSPESFNGEVTITATVVNNTNQIVLHAMEMSIEEIQVTVVPAPGAIAGGNLYSSYSQADDDTHLLRIYLTQQLVTNQNIYIRIRYTGHYAANMFGAYVSTYVENGQTVSLVTSQLQPTFARRVFPCFDEPALKAIFRTTIYSRPTHTVVRTNMPYRANELKQNVTGWDKYEFEDTPIMSTYLHGFLVSNFETVTNQQEIFNVTFSVYSRPGTQESAAFAMQFGQENMASLVDYYDFLYYLPKLDKVAVPDFAAGAMENWGIVIYREIALLVTDGVTTTASKQSVARLITHENVHLWIGNEVTPISWTYLWLSEGFATFFDHYAIDIIRPSWRMRDQFLLILQNVFQADAVNSVNPMTYPVYTPAEILGTFNAVAYQKSASVIRMLQHILTPEVFQLGVRLYIRAMSRRAAHPSDLYLHFQNAVVQANYSIGYTVEQILAPWVNQGGFPVLTIKRSASTANSVVVSQERYLTARANSTERWLVPVNWVLSSSPDFSDTKPMAWIQSPLPARSIDIPELSSAEWFIFNKQQTGYYRVNYDVQNWIAIAGALHTNHEVIHVLNRANLLDDAFNLARNGRLNYNVAFNLSRYLIQEKDYIPWGAVNPSFTYLEVALSASNAYPAFQNYLLNLTAPLYQELGFDASATEDHVTAFHRNIILNINCRHGNTDCVNTSTQLLEDLRQNRTQHLNPDIQILVYCSALRGGSEENFNFLWDLYLRSTDSGEQSILLNALGCTSNAERRTFYLNQVIATNSQVREQDRHTIVVSVINSSPESLDAALDFIHENFHLIQPRVQGLTGTTNILNALGRRLTSEDHLTRLTQLVSRHQSVFTAGEWAALAGVQENIAASITWTTENEASVEAWLNENYGSGAAAITSGRAIIDVTITDIDTRDQPIRLHRRNLEIDSITFTLGGTSVFDARFEDGEEDDILIIFTDQISLTYTFYIEYRGSLAMAGRAFYVGHHGDISYLAMNLHPTYARQVFPCMDEPTEQAVIKFTYNNVEFNTLLSNSQLEEGTTNEFRAIEGPAHGWGMIAHNFLNINLPTANVLLHARPGLQTQDAQASVAINSYFNNLQEWTDKDYFTIHLDQDGRLNIVALPDVSTNWHSLSVIGIWEPHLLMEAQHSIKQRKTAFYEIANAIAKQWFGYVIHPENWRFEWVVSGLASYAAYEMMRLFQTNDLIEDVTLLDVNTLFVTDVIQESLLRDAYVGTEPLEASGDLFNENDIRDHVNGLLKLKAPALLRMMRIVLGDPDQDFIQTAARSLLNRRAMDTVHSLHLVDAINSDWLADGNHDMIDNVHDFLGQWKDIAGYPLLHASVRQGGVLVTQEHFSFGTQQVRNFPIPITFTTSVVPNFLNYHPSMVIDGSFTIPVIVGPEDWILFNIQGQGYYRVNYDDILWERIIETLEDPETREIIHPLNRATLVDDALNLARAGKLHYDIAFRVVLTMEHETEYAVWKAFVRNMEFLRKRLLPYVAVNELDPDIYLRMVRRTIHAVEEELGFEPELNLLEPAMHTLTRGLVMEHACKANYDPCIAAAVELFWDQNNGEIVNPNIPHEIRPAVYCTMVREGEEDIIEALEERLNLENTLYERLVILESLACSQDGDFIMSLLEETISGNTYSIEERSKIFAAVAESSYDNAMIALNFMSANAEQIIEMYGGLERFEALISVLADNMADNDAASQFQIWRNAQDNNLGNSANVAQRAILTIFQNLNWNEANIEEVYEWIDENDASTMVLSFAAFCISVMVTLLNH
ncbi:unnamed protein product [Arctia plantaginis]|uniref:Aminopeptidase N n=1 Tax=Arctia plantaginis TaxID=874455 RepID=A0A8S1BUM2_ARCPL|nr:unnamed protein product [Arctia plantaginis]